MANPNNTSISISIRRLDHALVSVFASINFNRFLSLFLKIQKFFEYFISEIFWFGWNLLKIFITQFLLNMLFTWRSPKNIARIFRKINYRKHKCSGDLKVVAILYGSQLGFTWTFQTMRCIAMGRREGLPGAPRKTKFDMALLLSSNVDTFSVFTTISYIETTFMV